MRGYRLKHDSEGQTTVKLGLRGRAVLADPLLNRGTAFTPEQRRALGLEGLLPAGVSSLELQKCRALGFIRQKTDPLEQYIGLEGVHDRNAVLYYRLILDHVEEFLPVVYTPTVGLACQRFSRNFRQTRGLWITPHHRGRIADVLGNAPLNEVRLIVVTDNERILGLGDQGAGGMGIPIGKLVLYTVGAGIHPAQCLPISLDVGTDNTELLEDPLYLGWRERRLRGEAYYTLVEEFVEAVQKRFPQALLQWEDFKKGNAFTLLDRYRDRVCSFNDDIQGTAGVALAGVMAASRVSEVPMSKQRVVIAGGGAAGIGIARLLRDAFESAGMSGSDLVQGIAVLDSQGLLVEGGQGADPYKAEFAWPKNEVRAVGLDPDAPIGLHRAVETLKPTVLIGTTGQPGSFDERLVRSMAEHVRRPVIFPFSNPTSLSEALPADLIEWTDGRALIATGSPFDPVAYRGRTIRIGQGNNAYIFPGVGLGVLASKATRVSDRMFTAAARSVASMVTPANLEAGSLYPPLTELREISAVIARGVAHAAFEDGVAEPMDEAELDKCIARTMWDPCYPEIDSSGPVVDSSSVE